MVPRVRGLAALSLALALVTSGASAVPINPTNIRPVPVNPPFPGEMSLQAILDSAYGEFDPDVIAGQETAGMWRSVSPLFPTTTPILIAEFTANAMSQTLWFWSGIDTTAVTSHRIFNGGANPGTRATIAWDGPDLGTITQISGPPGAVNAGPFSGIPFNGFGFALGLGAPAPTFFTVDQLNGGTARALAYNPVGNDWLIAFEDGGDFDYNDLAFRIESLLSVPEPGALLILGAGLSGLGLLRRKRSRG